MSRKTLSILITALILAFAVVGCTANGNEEDLTASGTISAASLDISPELGGRIEEIYVQAGDTVTTGDALYALDDEVMQAQYDQAAAAVDSAEAAHATALEQLNATEVQLDLAEMGARYEELTSTAAQETVWPDDFSLPAWYYQSGEELAAVQQELDDAEAWLADEEENLADVRADINNEDFADLEADLAAAEQTYLVAQQNLFAFSQSGADEDLQDIAQEQFDAAKADLDSLQLEFGRILSDAAFDDLIDARGRVLVAQGRVDAARLKLDALLTGEDSLTVAAAESNVSLAQAQVEQAAAGIEQAQSALALLEIQLDKTTIYSPMDGTIISESLEVGQLVGAGITTMTIAKLDTVELTVYVPEDQYGVINLGDEVSVTVDSYLGETFTGTVEHIADEAEFTPRNVQTVEGRKATVYAIRILLPNDGFKLKPGMPADVTFIQ